MIKINLNRTRVTGGQEEAVVSPGSAASSAAIVPINARETIVKLFCMFLGIGSVMIYEKQNLDTLRMQVGTAQAHLNEIRQGLETKNAELLKLKDIEHEAAAIGDKLKILKEFSRLRLLHLQSLDFIQSVIPAKVWLRSIRLDAGQYTIEGHAIESPDLADFQSKLDGSAYFSDIVTPRAKPQSATSKVLDFQITAVSGRTK